MDIQWVREIERLIRSGQRDQAQSQFDEAAREAPENVYVLLARSALSYYADDYEEALRVAGDALESARTEDDKLAEATALRSQAAALGLLRRYEESLSAANDALEAARDAGDKVGEARSLQRKADALEGLRRYEESLSAADDALEVARDVGDKLAEGNTLHVRSDVLRMLNRYEESLSAADDALDVARDIGDKVAEGNALHVRSDALRTLGRYEESLSAVNDALEAAHEARNEVGEANALVSRSGALQMLGRYEESLSAANDAVEAARDVGSEVAEANALNSRSGVLRILGRHQESLSAANDALQAARDASHKVGEVNALVERSDALRLLGRYEESLSAANDAIELARTARYQTGQINALIYQVLALSELGRSENRDMALKDLAALDPARAQRVATYPMRAGPHWQPALRHIFKKKQEREQKQRQVLHVEPFEPELPEDSLGSLTVLRNWASYTAVDLMRSADGEAGLGQWKAGGGYFLWWQGWGLVIDPGLGFGKAFRNAGFMPRNISAVLATHHHIDHTGDMLPILTCLFEMNEEPVPPDIGEHKMDFLFGPGAFGAFADVVAYVPGVRSLRLMRPEESADLELPGGARATVKAVVAEHRDLTGRDDAAIGLRVDLSTNDGKRCSVGISGDSRFTKDAAEAFGDVDLMVVHIGSIYERDIGESDASPWHLGYSGVVQLLKEIKKHSKEDWKPLVLVSEWGEELGPDRSVICEMVVKSAGMVRVFPAEWKQSVALGAGWAQPICAREDGNFADHWHVAEGGYIDYLCGDHDHQSDAEEAGS